MLKLNITKFINKNKPLCICTFGVAIIGYMGYKAIRWIIKECSKEIEKINKVTQSHFVNKGELSPFGSQVYGNQPRIGIYSSPRLYYGPPGGDNIYL